MARPAELIEEGPETPWVPELERHEIGRRIKQVRTAAGLTQEGLAKALRDHAPGATKKALSGMGISRLELGAPASCDVSRLVQIANVVAGRGALDDTPPRKVFGYLTGALDRLDLYMS